MSGQKLDAKRIKISASVDRAIEEALRLKARELHVPVWVVIESALHEHLGRPVLSFEEEK
jgi:electron transfer flavoprotein alpha/beta subunit